MNVSGGITVLLAGAVLVALGLMAGMIVLALRSLLGQPRPTRARPGSDGVQECDIVVQGQYRPEVVRVQQGRPVRLRFHRQEDNPCSEWVFFSAFRGEVHLAPFAVTPVEFVPTETGEFLFTCHRGLYQGRLVVERPRRAPRWPPWRQ